MEQITTKETMTWVNHAIAHFNSMEKNQKELARILGIEESRLSEMKRGTAKMSPSLMENIIDICGAPKRGKGRFEFVEMYDDLSSFLESFDNVSDNFFFRRLNDALSRNDYVDALIHAYNLEPGSHDAILEKDRRELTISKVNEILKSTAFAELCCIYQDSLKSSNNSDFKWQNYQPEGCYRRSFKMNNLIIDTEEAFHSLYLQWLLLSQYSEYKFASDTKININPLIEYSPVVITGKRILTVSSGYVKGPPMNNHVTQQFGNLQNYNELPTRNSLGFINSKHVISVKPDLWNEAFVELYLSEAMNYHLLIHLSKKSISKYCDPEIHDEFTAISEKNLLAEVGKDDRVIVINNINVLNLFNNMEDIRKWCGLPSDNHYELKQEIAIAGGYVPGAKVLV